MTHQIGFHQEHKNYDQYKNRVDLNDSHIHIRDSDYTKIIPLSFYNNWIKNSKMGLNLELSFPGSQNEAT